MKPLLSWSMIIKAFARSSLDLLDMPHAWKNFLWLKVPASEMSAAGQ